MKDVLQDEIGKYKSKHTRRKRWQKVVAVLASITVFCTTYSLILPALTMERTYCDHEDGEEHTLQCYSNPYADKEEASDWEASLSGMVLSDDYGANVLAAAKTQLGYSQSKDNYLVAEDGTTKNGYTRYGEWRGNPYGEWNCMFTAFCACYAEVPGSVLPTADNVCDWILYVGGNEKYKTDEIEKIDAGDIAFVDTDLDGEPDVSAIAEASDDQTVTVIQGNVNGAVAEVCYDLAQVKSFIDLSQNEETSEEAAPLGKDDAFEDTEITENTEINDEQADAGESETTEEVLEPEVQEGPANTDIDTEESIEPENTEEAEDTENEEQISTIIGYAADGAMVSVSGRIPDGAEVSVVPVFLSDDEIKDIIGDNATVSLLEYAAYDITIYVGGEEWQPEDGVSVSITRPSIDIEEGERFEVAHVDSLGNSESVKAQLSDEGDVVFEAEGFSLYLIYTYTVDFHYSDFSFSIPGGNSILLSELFEALDIKADVAEVSDVEFTDESLIRIEKITYADSAFDWRILSLQAFDTDEELTATLNNGDVIHIHVTDAKGDIVTPSTGMKTHYNATYDPAAGMPNSSANNWQVVSQGYAAVKAGDGVYSYAQDNAVRLQKAVIPTGTENEFQVYLNVEPRLSWEEFFKSLDNYQTHNSSSTFNPSSGCSRLLSQNEYDNLSASEKKLFSPVSVTYDPGNGKTYTVVRYGNFTGDGKDAIQDVPNGSYAWSAEKFNTNGLINKINWRGLLEAYEDGKPLSLVVDMREVAKTFDFATDPVYPQTVTDPMGQDIIYRNKISFDEGSVSEPAAGSKGGTLVWTLPVAEYPDPPYFSIHTVEGTIPGTNVPGEVTVLENVTVVTVNGKLTAYYTGVLEGRYAISLDVSHSAAPLNNSPSNSIVPTNGTTTLRYDVGQTGKNANFPIPQVRGLLYDITFIKFDGDKTKRLEGAVFGLYQSDGKTPVLDENGNPYTVTTSKTQVSRFADLTFGTYVLRELQAPTHYSPSQDAWTLRLCYTDAASLLTPDTAPYEHNMRYKGNDTNGQWEITNPRKPFRYAVEVIKLDEKGEPLSGAYFSLPDPEHAGQTLTGQTDQNGKYLFDAPFNANIAYILSEIAPPGGYFSLPEGIQFRVDENTDDDTYTVVFINSDDFPGTVSMKLRETGTGNDTKYVLEVTVENEPVYELPHTGGIGTAGYTAAGAVLMGAAILIDFCSRRKRERRSTK